MKKSLLIIFIFLLLLIGFFPFLASTSIGKPFFTALLKTRMKGDIRIEKLNLSWLGPQYFENVTLSNPQVQAKITLLRSNAPFWKLSHLSDSFTLQSGTFTFPNYGDAKITDVQAEMVGHHLNATGSTPQGGSFAMRGTILSKQDFDITAELNQIPTIAFDQLFGFHGLAYKALGKTLNANGACTFKQNEGSITIDLSSPQLQGSINGTIANDLLTLNKPLIASLKINKALADEILTHISPNILTEFEIQNPVSLLIQPAGFSCPIYPFSFNDLQIQTATLDLGKVLIQSGDSLQFLIKLFKNQNFQKKIDIWFTPVTLQIQNGILELGRMDALLSHSTHLCTWGNVDMKKDKLHMFLGIPSDTLEESFGIRTLSRNYVLKIPVRGSLSNPKFDTGPAIARIATMATAQQIPTKGGKIFGGIVGAVTQVQDEGDAPPPNRPFPWEK